ncbi:MAG: hypothetical protein V5A52_04515 [Halovenus sp.]
MTSSETDTGSGSRTTWSILGLGGVVSLCCVFATPLTAGGAGTAAGAGSAAALGGTLLQIAVTALTVGLFGVVLALRKRS